MPDYINGRNYWDVRDLYFSVPRTNLQVLPQNQPYEFHYVVDTDWQSEANAIARKELLDTGFWVAKIQASINRDPNGYNETFQVGPNSNPVYLADYARIHNIPVVTSSGGGYAIWRKDFGFPEADYGSRRVHPCVSPCGQYIGGYSCPESYCNDSKYRYNNAGTPLTWAPFIRNQGRYPERMMPMFPECVDMYYKIEEWCWNYSDDDWLRDYGFQMADSWTSSIRHEIVELAKYGLSPVGITWEAEQFYVPWLGQGARVWNDSVAGQIEWLNSTPTAGGSGYQAWDLLTITGGGGSSGTAYVQTVGTNGTVTKLQLQNAGTGYTRGSGLSTSGGHGSGCTIEIYQTSADAGTYDDLLKNDTRFNVKSPDMAPNMTIMHNYIEACKQTQNALIDRSKALGVNFSGLYSNMYEMWIPDEPVWETTNPILMAWGRPKSTCSFYCTYYGTAWNTMTAQAQRIGRAASRGRHVFDVWFDCGDNTANSVPTNPGSGTFTPGSAAIAEGIVMGKMAMALGGFRLSYCHNYFLFPDRNVWVMSIAMQEMQPYADFIKYGENVIPPASVRRGNQPTVCYGKDYYGADIPWQIFVTCRVYNRQAMFFAGTTAGDSSSGTITVHSPFGGPATISYSPFGVVTVI